jgi:RNA-directed DNA polymerase
MRAAIRELNLRHRTDLPLDEIARQINPLLRGWIEYYRRYSLSALYPLLRYVNQMLLAWVMPKVKRFKAHKIRTSRFLQKIGSGKCGSVRALATGHDRYVCLMGAV